MDWTLNNKIEELIRDGDIVASEALLLDKLASQPESPFHVVAELDFTGSGTIAKHLKGFYARQSKRFDVAVIYTEINGFTINREWSYSAFAYRQYDGIDSIDHLGHWEGETTPYLLNGLFKLQRGFKKRYLLEEYETVGEITRLLVIVKFIKLMGEAANEMKTVRVPFVVSAHDSSIRAEFHPSKAA